MAKRKRSKGQTTIYKLLRIKLKIEYPFGIVINTVIVTAGNFEP
jgi:hypothetical protein